MTTVSKKQGSWFLQIRELCLTYRLPDPLILIKNPPSKAVFKKKYKTNVIVYWEQKLRSHASGLRSLLYFKTSFMSLSSVHPLWSTCSSNPYEVNKAVVQARMLSGRYRTQSLRSHFDSENVPHCKLCSSNEVENLTHILIECQALESIRINVIRGWLETQQPSILNTVLESLHDELSVQFLLDCSVLPSVIVLTQTINENIVLPLLFKLTRNYCFNLHKGRQKLLGLWERL